MEFLRATKVKAECLPERKGMKAPCNTRTTKHQVSRIKTGKRGGRFMLVDGVKVYLQ